MVGSNGTLMTMRLVRSKLRKREESTSATPAAIEAHNYNYNHRQSSQQFNPDQQIFTTSSLIDCNNSSSNHNNYNNTNNNTSQEYLTFTRTSGNGTEASSVNNWIFPPKAPTPNIYNCVTNDALMAANEKNGFKGFRKQFSGRFKRLVTKKPEPTSVIPPELKPQLKTIYVY